MHNHTHHFNQENYHHSQKNRHMHLAGRFSGHRRKPHGDHDNSDRHGRFPLFRGRKFGGDDIQLLIMYFLSLEANYGYELIKQFSNRSNGVYVPSPGVIYPALTYLEEAEYVSSQNEGNRKRYSLSEKGKEHLNQNQQMVDNLLAKLDQFAEKLKSMSNDENERNNKLSPELRQALDQLRHVLHQYHTSNVEQQQKIATIINEAITKLQQLDNE